MVCYLLVHGAANGPWVFEGWDGDLGAPCDVADLQPLVGPGTSMEHYAAAVRDKAAAMAEAPVLIGWSLGGLIVLMAARGLRVPAVVVLEPSAPAEVIGHAAERELREGTIGPEFYGVRPGAAPPPGLSGREWTWVIERSAGARDSLYARDQRQRGIDVGPVAAPLLVVHGDVEGNAEQRGPAVARALAGDTLKIAGASHWALVVGERYRREVRGGIRAWVGRVLAPERN